MTIKRMLIMLIACLIVFGGVFGMKYMGGKAMNDYFDNMPPKPATITSTQAQSMSWAQSIPTVGTLVAVNGTDITNEVPGIVQQIHFTGGSSVSQGDLLVSLDSGTEKAELERLQAQAQIAQTNLRRVRDLYQRKALSQSEFDQKKAEAAAAKAAAQAQQARLDQKQIRAPFDGVLGIRRINVGEYLSPGTALVGLQQLDPMEMQFSLPENQLSLVATDMTIQLQVDAWPQQDFSGTISVIEPSVDPATRNFMLRARLPNPEHKLRAGMFAKVQVQRGSSLEVVAIPRTAVKYDSYGTSVFVIGPSEDDPEQKVAKNRFIRIGQSRGDFVQVLEGLEAGDEVVAAGLLKLRNGLPVIIDNSVPVEPSLNPDVADS